MIDITLLGTGATMPLPDRALTAVHLSFGGRSILFDCGEGTQASARKAGVSLMKTDLIALSHYHGDHIFGLPGLLQTLGCMDRRDPLLITGPEGLGEALQPILQLAGALPYPVKLLSLPESGSSIQSFLPRWSREAFLFPVKTRHRVPSLGYRFFLRRPGLFHAEKAKELGIPQRLWGVLQHGEPVTLENGQLITPEYVLGEERKGLSFVFSGDTAPCEDLTLAASGADLFICEATYGDDSFSSQAEEYGHCTFSQSARMARDAGTKRLWLTHFSQILREPEEALPYASAVFSASECGSDGLHLTLNWEE